MLIGIDTSRAVKTHKRGIERYAENLIYEFSQIDHGNDFILYAPNKPTDGKLTKLPKNFKWKIIPFPKLWSQIRLSWEMKFGKTKPDVMFEPAHTIPLWCHKKTIVTMHDLGFLHYPELFTPLERIYHKWSMSYAAKHANHIITISDFSKKDIEKTYKIKPEKITTIHLGFDSEIFKKYAGEKNKKPKTKYIFFIGQIEEKKNIKGIIETFKILKTKYKIPHELILAGKPGYKYNEIEEKINSLPDEIKKAIIIQGYVSEKDLVNLMKDAEVFFFPSFFEGFGLPILEAFAAKTPVVTSNITSMPEIADDAALLVDPSKPKQMAEAINKIIKDQKLRKKLIEKGNNRIKQFSWQKTARETLKTIKELAKK